MGQPSGTDKTSNDEEEANASPSLRLLLSAFMRARRLILQLTIGAFGLSLFYVTVLHKPEYTATAVVGPVEADTSSSGVRQALAAYTGVATGGIGTGNFTKFTEMLTSARLAEALHRKYGLAEVVFPGMWDAEKREWKRPSGLISQTKETLKPIFGLRPWSPPNAARFAQFLKKRLKVTRVGGNTPFDLRNQTTAVSISMDDPEKAARFLTLAIATADELCRQDQLVNSQRRAEYLTNQLKQTNEIILQQSLQQLLVGEQQSLLTLHANRFYAVDVIDTPHADTVPIGTRSVVLLAQGLFGGIFLALAIVYWTMRKRLGAGMSPEAALAKPFVAPIDWIVSRLRGR